MVTLPFEEWSARLASFRAIGEGGSGCDSFANYLGGEAHRVLSCQFEQAVAGIASHVLVAVVLGFNVDHGGAVRAFAFVQVAIIPLVIVGLGDPGQCCGLRNGVFCVLARFAGEAVRMTPWCFRELRAVSAAQAANIVFVANRVAVFLAAFVALGATRYLVPGAVDSLGIQPDFRRIKPNLWQSVAMWPVVAASVPDIGSARAQALSPIAGDFRDQDFGVLVHDFYPVRRRPP